MSRIARKREAFPVYGLAQAASPSHTLPGTNAGEKSLKFLLD
jgi:hypothetical protein